jgi:hypothetical protein
MTILKVFKPEELDIAAAVEAIYRLLLVSATYGDSVKSRRRVGTPQMLHDSQHLAKSDGITGSYHGKYGSHAR